MEEDIEFITFDGDVITKSDIRDEIIDNYINSSLDGLTKITDFNIGSEAYHLADVMASFILEHRELIDLNYRMSMIHTAEGEFLDNMGDMRGIHRYGSSPSIGTVKFTRLSENTDEVIYIADGTQVSTTDAISFIVDAGEDVDYLIIDSGETEITANVICEQEGSYTNVLPNTIVLVMGDIGSKVSVTNEEKFTEGSDIESDDDYRQRIILSPFDVPIGTLQWYENMVNELEDSNGNKLIHDSYVVKGLTSIDADIIINFNPTNRNDVVTRLDLNEYNEDNDYESTVTGVMTKGRESIIELFSMKEYDVVGIKREYHMANQKTILSNGNGIEYIFGVVLENGYSLNTLKQNIKNKIIDFNKDASIGLYFNPSVLALMIENEIEGINLCKIIKKENGSYQEMLEPIEVDEIEVFDIDMDNIENKIQTIDFNVNVGD